LEATAVVASEARRRSRGTAEAWLSSVIGVEVAVHLVELVCVSVGCCCLKVINSLILTPLIMKAANHLTLTLLTAYLLM
jgi:hypothetical protein